jgi:hypothetical protein
MTGSSWQTKCGFIAGNNTGQAIIIKGNFPIILAQNVAHLTLLSGFSGKF